MNYDVVPETVAEALARFDSGWPVFTVMLSGLGPYHEQAIHVLSFEIMREFVTEKLTAEDIQKREGEIRGRRDEAMGKVGEWGFSGAQVGVATQHAFNCLTLGYREAIKKYPPDRLIQVNNKLKVA